MLCLFCGSEKLSEKLKAINYTLLVQSISLWCEYINFVQECDPSVRECSAAGILKARNLFERALTAAGLHVAEGSKIWEAYREFELAIFHTIDETNVEVSFVLLQFFIPLPDSYILCLYFVYIVCI